jgi:O-Antigen ligase/Tetratricopeptide repeat
MRSGANGIFAALGVLLAAALLGGEERFFFVGAASLIVAAAALGAALWGLIPRPVLSRSGLVAVGLFAAFVLWSGASLFWSDAPDRSWDFFNRALVYLAFLVVGLFVARRRFADLLAGLLGLLLTWALVTKVFALDDGRRARLNEPVGYWNTLGLLAATGVPLALRLASRTQAVLLLYASVVAVLLTQSRGGLLLATVAAAVWLFFEREYEPALRLAVAVPPGLAVGAFGLALDGVSKDGQPHSERLGDGLWLGLALVLGAVAVLALARLEVPERALRLAAYVVVPVAALAFLFIGVRAILDFSDPVTPESPTRLVEGSSNNRAQWWEEAGRGFVDNPIVGNGAGGFQVTHRRYRESNVEVREPHSLPLQLLTETGLVGFALFAGSAVAFALAIRRERALVLVVALFALGVLYDIHWDFTAAGAVAFSTLGVLLPRGDRMGGRETLWAAGVVALALAGVYSLGAPWLADRRVDQAYDAINAGDLATASDRARQARALNPTSVEPLFALAFIQDAEGQFDRAREYYARATEVQPENRETWFQLGRLEYERERYADAVRRFDRMFALDPRGPHVLWLRRAQCKLNPTIECPEE